MADAQEEARLQKEFLRQQLLLALMEAFKESLSLEKKKKSKEQRKWVLVTYHRFIQEVILFAEMFCFVQQELQMVLCCRELSFMARVL